MMNKKRINPGFAEGFVSAIILITGIAALTAGAAISFNGDESDLIKSRVEAQTISMASIPAVDDTRTDLPVVINEKSIQPEKTIVLSVPDTTEKSTKEEIIDAYKEAQIQAQKELTKALEMQKDAMKAYQKAIQQEKEAQMKLNEEYGIKYRDYYEQYNEEIGEELQLLLRENLSDSVVSFYRHFEWPDVQFPEMPEFPELPTPVLQEHFNYFDLDSLCDVDKYVDQYTDAWKDYKHDFYFDKEDWSKNNFYFDHNELLENIELPEMPELPELFWIEENFPTGFKTESILKQELLKDELIERRGDYVIELNSKEMLINGEKQSRATYKKYKRLLESMEDEELETGFKFRFII